jgi:N-acyl-D-amino-acid deacylase
MQLLDEDLRQGALGLGSPSGYMAKGLSSYEQLEAQRTAARYGRLTSFHTRFHGNPSTPTEATIGADEAMMNAVVLDAPMIIGHDNDYGWWEIEEKLQALRKKGYVMWGEYYPYAKSGGTPQAEYLLPENFVDKYHYDYEKQVYDPSQDKYLTQEEVAELRKTDPARQLVISLPAREKWMSLWIRTPGMTVGSDAVPTFGPDGKLLPEDGDPALYRGHPRTAGSAPKVLRLAREDGVPLLFTLSQLSYWPAMYLGDAGIEQMKDRGRMQEGMVADIVIFDPVTVKDNATFKQGENGLPPDGIPHVIVNGKIAVRDGRETGIKAGLPIRYPVQSEGRFVPLDNRKWEGRHLINVPHLHLDDGSCIPDPKSL